MHGCHSWSDISILVLFVVCLAGVGGLTGCTDSSGPVIPQDNHLWLPMTPTAVVDSLAFALARQDSQVITALLSPEFEFHTGIHTELAGTEFLEYERFQRAMANLCNIDPQQQPCVPTIVATDLSVVGDWSSAPDDIMPGRRLLYSGVAVSLKVQSDDGCAEFDISGFLDFYVEAQVIIDAGDSNTVYRLAALRDRTGPCGEPGPWTCFTKLVCAYLPAGLPRAQLTASRLEGTTIDAFIFDASASACGGFGLHPEPYRWRLDDNSLGTIWSDSPDWLIEFPEPGRHVVTLEVRNTVGWVSQRRIEFEVFATQPASFAELLATIAYAHRIQNEWLIGICLDPTFVFEFATKDVDIYDLPIAQLSFPRMMRAISRLFSENQPHDGPPPATAIEFYWDMELASPEATAGRQATTLNASGQRITESHHLHMAVTRREYDTLQVDGQVTVTAAPTRILAADGQPTTIWRLTGIKDKTNASADPTNDVVSWGWLLALYYF